MSGGINEDKINILKVELLDCMENLNSISNRFDNCTESISSNIDGIGKNEIVSKLNEIKSQLPKVSSNISSYIDDLDKVISNYEKMDIEAANTLISNISKLGEGSD